MPAPTTSPPDALTDAEIEELATELRRLQDEISAALEASIGGDAPVDLDEPIGRLSRMDAIQQQEMRKTNRRGHEIRLRNVRASLAALARGDYGSCAECEEPVGFRRLKARPESRFCLACQRKREEAE